LNHLIIYAHPKTDSFNGAILRTYKELLLSDGHSVETRDLYRMDFDPILRSEEYEAQLRGDYSGWVKTEWRHWQRADVITLIFPVWWGGLPAAAKGYLDRMLAYGLAYELEGEEPIPLLIGKKAVMIYTSGTPQEIYERSGMKNSINQTLNEGIFDFCGLESVGQLHFGNVVLASDEEHDRMLREVGGLAGKFREGGLA
jgi:NAD(P)H dehydrogenase (quinone)